MPLDAFQPLFDLPDITWVSLHKEDPGSCGETPLLSFGAAIGTMEPTAALIANLDLVISVDTSIAHLGGALGREVWTLLAHTADWRWLEDRADSPWYPGMRLFRQARPGDWAGVIEEVRGAISQKYRVS